MLFGVINKLHYTPDIKMMNGKIISLTVKYNDTVFVITLSDTKQNDSDVWISEEDFDLYHTIDDNFYNGLICNEHMSYYNEVTKNIESSLPIGPKSGYFSEHNTRPLLGIDSRKAYTSDFMKIEYYPVYNNFDIWQKYNGHKIDDYNQYIVQVEENANPILFSGVYSRCYGYKLNRIKEKYNVLYYKKPSNLVMSNSKDLVGNLYESKLPTDLKKFIANKNLGLIEKRRNKKSISRAFKNYNEAFFYQTRLDKGQVYSIIEEETVSETNNDYADPLDYGLETVR